MKWYYETLLGIITSPQEFFQNMSKGTWSEEPLTFALITGWMVALCLTLVVFLNSYLPTGLTLIEGIYGKKLIIAFPVLAVMGVAFFLMTLFILSGIIIIAILGIFSGFALLLNVLFILLGSSGGMADVLKACLYTSYAMLAGCLNILLMIPVKYKLLPIGGWVLLEKVVFYLLCIYLFVIFGIIGEKTHKLPRWRAILAATVPFVLLVLFNIVFSHKVLPKLAGILS